MKKNKTFWFLLLVCILMVIPFLGIYDYNTKGEPRESIVSYTMLESGNWILPRNSVGEMAYKPPMFYWAVAAVSNMSTLQLNPCRCNSQEVKATKAVTKASIPLRLRW